jgi:hypothetical protein
MLIVEPKNEIDYLKLDYVYISLSTFIKTICIESPNYIDDSLYIDSFALFHLTSMFNIISSLISSYCDTFPYNF